MPADKAKRIKPLTVPELGHKEVERTKGDHPVPAKCTGMHVPDGPVGVMAERVDRADRHHRPFKGRHAIKADRNHHHPDHRIGAQLVPGARQRHQPVDHPAPGRHPQHDREDHPPG